MDKICKHCNILLTLDNRSGKRLLCKPCRVKQVSLYNADHIEQRRMRVNCWARRIGKVKEYPCVTCSNPCYKKYSLAFCSDKCRLLFYVEKTATCWIWKGATNRRGYGKICFKGNKTAGAHRVSYELFTGEIPEDKYVCHSCDNPRCVNPDHLWVGSAQDNKMDQINKGRGSRKLTESDVIEIRNLSDKGLGSQRLAYLYRVTCGLISNIIKRRIWKHIT